MPHCNVGTNIVGNSKCSITHFGTHIAPWRAFWWPSTHDSCISWTRRGGSSLDTLERMHGEGEKTSPSRCFMNLQHHRWLIKSKVNKCLGTKRILHKCERAVHFQCSSERFLSTISNIRYEMHLGDNFFSIRIPHVNVNRRHFMLDKLMLKIQIWANNSLFLYPSPMRGLLYQQIYTQDKNSLCMDYFSAMQYP